MEPHCFYDHALEHHAVQRGHHSYNCPVCVLFYGWDESRPSPNLIEHLKETHPEMEGASANAQSYVPDEEAAFDLDQASVGSQCARLTLRESDCFGALECPICLSEFFAGQAAVRMDCFCLFHMECVSAWFDKVRCVCGSGGDGDSNARHAERRTALSYAHVLNTRLGVRVAMMLVALLLFCVCQAQVRRCWALRGISLFLTACAASGHLGCVLHRGAAD